jgi:hypothetical protein
MMSTIFLMMLIFFFPFQAFAASSKCLRKYEMAARALEEKRAKCGISEMNDKAFCKVASQINIPLEVYGYKFSLNVASIYRFLNDLKILPNNFRRTAKLIYEAQVGRGRHLRRVTKRISRSIAGVSAQGVAQVINEFDHNQTLCPGDQLYTYREVREMLEEELIRR